MPDPDDQADGFEHSSDLPEQRGDLAGLVESAELDTETGRSRQVRLGERGRGALIGAQPVAAIRAGGCVLRTDSQSEAGKRTGGRGEEAPKPGRRPRGRRRLVAAGDDRRLDRHHFNRIGVELQEFADDHVGLEGDGVSVGANEGAAENAGRPARDVVPLQPFEKRQLDLRLLGDGGEIDLLSFTPLA